MCRMLLNEKLNGVELYFEGKPNQEIINNMKSNGYRWNGKKFCWYAKQNNETLELANELSVSEVKEVVKEDTTKSNTIDLWSLTQFEAVERELIYDNKEIAKQVRSYLRKRFPFVKFSIRSDRSSIDCDIVSSPFKEESKYLKAIQEYCRKYVNTYNYDNSDDPTTNYLVVNFYGGYFQTSWKYEQTEITEEVKEMMSNFDKSELKAFESKKAEEEKAYQEYLIKREQEQKEYELRVEEEKKEVEYINNNVEVIEIEEDKQYFIKNAKFANLNKNNTLEQYKEEVIKGDYYLNTLKVEKEVHFKDAKSLKYFENMLLHDFDFIKGTGGSYTEDLRVNSMSDHYNMSSEDRNTVEWLLKGIAVYNNNELQFIIDAQGYNYARYVGLIDNTITTIEKEYNCKQVVTIEEVEELKTEANEIIGVYNSVLENNTLENWYNTRKKLVKEIRSKDLWLHASVVQQIEDEIIKDYMYMVLKENDTIKDQLLENELFIGEKLTIVRESAIGGAGISHIIFNNYELIESYQYKDVAKITIGIKNKKGLYTTNINNSDNVIIYRGWIDIPESVLYEDTSNEYCTGKATKFGSYDKQALDAITSYLRKNNIYPIINTYRPIF